MFVGWIKEGEEHKTAFENSSAILMGQVYLRGTWNVIRKIRLVRLIRKMIEEGIVVRGVKEIYEEGCKILSEMERREVKEDEEEYMFELYMMKVRGIEKKMKEDEVEVLRRKLEEAGRGLEEVNKRLQEEKKKRADAERREMEAKRMKDESERGREEEKKKREESEKKATEEKREMEDKIRNLTREVNELKHPKEEMPSIIKSLSKFNFYFSDPSKLTVQGNRITHVGGSDTNETCVFKETLKPVCIMSS